MIHILCSYIEMYTYTSWNKMFIFLKWGLQMTPLAINIIKCDNARIE